MRRDIERKNKLLGLDLSQTGGNHLERNGLHAVWYGYSAVCGYSFALAAGNWPHVRPRGNALRLPNDARPFRADSGQIAFGFLEKNRRWAGRDHAPRSQRHLRWSMVGGLAGHAAPAS